MTHMKENKKIETLDFSFNKLGDINIPSYKPFLYRKKYWKSNENDDLYEHLLFLKRNSSLHGSIINDKIRRVYGTGLLSKDVKSASLIKQKYNKIFWRLCNDYEIFGGAYLYVQWNKNHSNIINIKHIPFQKIRKNPDDMFFYKNNWHAYVNEKAIVFPKFDVEEGTGAEQILEIKIYETGDECYTLPSYFSGIKAIATDINIDTFFSSTVSNNFAANTIIDVPAFQDPEKKTLFEKNFYKKMTGPENSGATLLLYRNGDNPVVNVNRLNNDINAGGMIVISKETIQRILCAHRVSSPILYGIETPGSLGNSTEIYNAELIYESTVITPDRDLILEELMNLNNYLIYPLVDISVKSISIITQIEDTTNVTDSNDETELVDENKIGFKIQNKD